MTPETWLTLVLLISMSIALIKEWFPSEITIFSVVLVMLLSGIITVEEAFHGFSNPGLISIGLLFVVAGAIYNTGILHQISHKLFGDHNQTLFRALMRIVFPVAGISAFMNNTPVVAIMIPAIRAWAEKHDLAPSRFLIPISFAAILGGMTTLIGTSTNLIVHGLMMEFGLPGLSLFEITPVGVPVALVGLIFLVLVGGKLLPERKQPMVELGKNTREFVIALRVTEEYAYLGKTIEQAGLRHLKGLFLFQIERQGQVITPAPPDEVIRSGDRLFFTGLPKTILELQKTPGLVLTRDASFDLKQYDNTRIKAYEAVVSPGSPLIGKNVRESNFRQKYDAVIIAIHRHGERIQQKIGDIVLRPGDTLLLLADRDFRNRYYHSNDFYLVSPSDDIPSRPRWQAYVSVAIFLGMLVLTVGNIFPLVVSALLAVVLVLLSGILRPVEARATVDFRVLTTIAGAFAISEGIRNSGLAQLLASGIIEIGHYGGSIGIVGMLFLVTSLYTTVITSNATAALLFPVAYSVAQSTGLDPHALGIAVAIAAAGSFATPISYQTNMMVYGPGGYRFADFLRIGIPLQLLTGVAAILVIYLVYLR